MALISAAQSLAMILALEGEAITYLEPGREPKAIVAMIDRNPAEIKEFRSMGTQAGGSVHGRTIYHMTVANQETDGMTSIRRGQDKVQLKKDVQDVEDTTFVVSAIIHQDAGAWTLEVTA